MNGKVIKLNESKGYGFVRGYDGLEYFLHVKGCVVGYTPKVGDDVEYSIETYMGRERCTAVCPSDWF